MNPLNLILSDAAPRTPEHVGHGSGRGETGSGVPKRILFLCGSLEPGRDGVGDYSRLLMAQCRVLGWECCAVALNDHHVTQSAEAEDAGATTELRLPATMPWPERVAIVANLRARFHPGWISMQFVPYAFNAKGIVWNVHRHLQSMMDGARQHIMFHELWVGASRTASWKERAMGKLQQTSILRLIRALAPEAMTTSNRTYIKMLGACGVSAQKLPLFGNIAVARRDEALPSASRALLASRVSFDLNQRDSYWLVLFFGTLHPEWKPEPVLSIIHRAAIAVKRRVCFVALGRLGAAGEEKWSLMAERYAASFSFVAMGEQEAGTLSQLFQEADFGIAASPWQLIGKSGSAAAMLEHGLPVIANRDDWRARHIDGEDDTPDPLLHRCDNSLEKKLIAGLPKRRPMGGAQEVARQFVKSLCPENA